MLVQDTKSYNSDRLLKETKTLANFHFIHLILYYHHPHGIYPSVILCKPNKSSLSPSAQFLKHEEFSEMPLHEERAAAPFIALIVLVHESNIPLPQHMDESCNTNYILNTQARWYSLRLLMKKEDVYLQTWGRKEYIYKQREPIKSIKGKNFLPRCISRRYPARSINSEPARAFVRKRDFLTNVPHVIPIISF